MLPMPLRPNLLFPYHEEWKVPTVGECFRIWKKYQMMSHIKAHCLMVARVALTLARRFEKAGYPLREDLVLASALLHDIAKSYTIYFGGDHAILGSAWVMQEIQNPLIAQAVLAHVIWFFDEGEQAIEKNPCTLANLISYSDKRVQHDRLVTLSGRFEDLIKRYGTTEEKRRLININYTQSQKIENAFIRFGVDIKLEPGQLVRIKQERKR
jgi:putative nucleotidyltransferase with HDIG domain